MKKLLALLIALVIRLSLMAQSVNPGEDDIYRPGELATIRLTLAPADKAFLLDPANTESDIYLRATFQMINSRMDTILPIDIGIRLRGNTSRYQPKKPFKIDFKEFDGKKFFGYKKFNLKPDNNDPSQVREPLTLQYYRVMNVPAARTHPLKLYMNEEYMGVYLNVEQIDDVFLEARYGNEDGFLYKCSYGANLLDNGQVYNTDLYSSEINEDADTRLEINHFVHVLNTASDQDFVTAIENVFNVDLYLRQLSVESLLGHWDGYSYNVNNFYLYYNGQTGKVEFFPYDTDNTWGIDWLGQNWGTRDLNNWANENQPRPLTQRILQVPAYKLQYQQYLMELLNNYFKSDYLMPIMNSYKTILSQAVQEDTYFDDSFGFTHNDFLNSFSIAGMNNQVKYGITGYLKARSQSAHFELGVVSATESSEIIQAIYPNPSHLPRTCYVSNTGTYSTPLVYSATGVLMPVTVSVIDDKHSEISLPHGASSGVYIVRIDSNVYRWIYQ